METSLPLPQVIKIIEQRVKDGQTAAPRCGIEAVEARRSFAGGFYHRADGAHDCHGYDVTLSVLVPPDAEYRKVTKKTSQGNSKYITSGNRNRKAAHRVNFGLQ